MSSVYQVVTDRILSMLEAGVCPWKAAWSGEMPANLISRKPYRGINRLMLASAGYDSPYFLTFNQARALKGSVKRGARGLPVIFYCVREEIDLDGRLRKDFVLKFYTVFHASQCERIPVPPPVIARAFNPIERCEQIVHGYRECPRIEHGGDRAAYAPAQDLVLMPRRESFDSEPSYYATLFHELSHSSGSSTRLKRPGVCDPFRFGSHDYGKEELVAELAASFLAAEAGISDSILPASASYLHGWLQKLRAEPRWLVEAGAQAEKAADWILGRAARADEHPEAQAA